VLRTLAQLHPKLPSERQALVSSAMRRAVLGLTRRQHRDGGFGAFGGASFFRLRKQEGPSSLLSMINDASSPDLTGRVVMALLAARSTGGLDAAAERRLDRMVGRARRYLERTHSPYGGWWSAWTTGHLGGAAFALPPLRALGAKPEDALLRKERAFLLGTQRSDGGWSESTDVDRHPSQAGQGGALPSTPAQTAFAMIGLLACAADGDREIDAALAAGARFLLASQRDGGWTNGRPLYTMYRGLEYYDAPEMTTTMVLQALHLYRERLRLGSERAITEAVRGQGQGS
jgi:squalene cyclase